MKNKEIKIIAIIFCLLTLTGVILYFVLPGKNKETVSNTNEELNIEEYAKEAGLGYENGYLESSKSGRSKTFIKIEDTATDLSEPSVIEGLTKQEASDMGLRNYGEGDTDLDGLSDKEEIEVYNSDPLKMSTSGDLYSDKEKVELGLDIHTHYDRDMSEMNEDNKFLPNDLQKEDKSFSYEVNTYDDYCQTYFIFDSYEEESDSYEFQYPEHDVKEELARYKCMSSKREISMDISDYTKQGLKAKDLLFAVERDYEYIVVDIKSVDDNTVSFKYPFEYKNRADMGWSTYDTLHVYAKNSAKIEEGTAFSKLSHTTNGTTDPTTDFFKKIEEYGKSAKGGKLLNKDIDFLVFDYPLRGIFFDKKHREPRVYITQNKDTELTEEISEEICNIINNYYLPPSYVEETGGLKKDMIKFVPAAQIKSLKQTFKSVAPKDCYCNPYDIERNDDGTTNWYTGAVFYWFDYDQYCKYANKRNKASSLDKEKAIEIINNSCKVTYDDFFSFPNFKSKLAGGHCCAMAWITASVYNNGNIDNIISALDSRAIINGNARTLEISNADDVSWVYNEDMSSMYDKGLSDIELTPNLSDFLDAVWVYYNATLDSQFHFEEIIADNKSFELYSTESYAWYEFGPTDWETINSTGQFRNATGKDDLVHAYSWESIENVKNYLDQDKIAIVDISNSDVCHTVNVYDYTEFDYAGHHFVLFSVYENQSPYKRGQKYLTVMESHGTYTWYYIPETQLTSLISPFRIESIGEWNMCFFWTSELEPLTTYRDFTYDEVRTWFADNHQLYMTSATSPLTYEFYAVADTVTEMEYAVRDNYQAVQDALDNNDVLPYYMVVNAGANDIELTDVPLYLRSRCTNVKYSVNFINRSCENFINDCSWYGDNVSFEAWPDNETYENALLFAQGKEDEIENWDFEEIILGCLDTDKYNHPVSDSYSYKY